MWSTYFSAQAHHSLALSVLKKHELNNLTLKAMNKPWMSNYSFR